MPLSTSEFFMFPTGLHTYGEHTNSPVMETQWIEKARSPFFRALLPLYVALAAGYLIWRTVLTLSWNIWYAWPLLACEVVSIAMTFLYLFTARHQIQPVFKPAPVGKTIDALIPTYNEPEHIVKMTALGALQIRGIRNVLVLDDGNRPAIKKMAEEIGAKYLARGENSHAKAGNMNAGLKETDAEFILCLDCDHVPQPQFIERTLGYFEDPNLAFVQTPQLFYNTHSIQFRPTHSRPLWNEQTMFYESIQPSKNYYNAAFFCGSGALLRRAAVDSISGFATGTATEDIHSSLKIHAKGWNSIFISEPLAHGIAPNDLTEYHKQRTRWGAGSLGLLFRSPDSPLAVKGLTLMQRLCYFNSTFSFMFGLQRIFYIAIPALILITLPFSSHTQTLPVLTYLGIFLPFLAFSYFATWLYSDGTFHPIYTEQYNIANIFSSILAMRGIIQVQKKFSVSTKVKTMNQRDGVQIDIAFVSLVLFVADVFGVFYWTVGLHLGWTAVLQSPVGLAFFWNTINLGMFYVFSQFLASFGRRAEPMHTLATPNLTAFLEPSPQSIKQAQATFVDRLGLEGALVRTSYIPALGNYTLSINTGSQDLTLTARVATSQKELDGTYQSNLTFMKVSPLQALALTRLLFHEFVPRTLVVGRKEKTSRATEVPAFALSP